MKWDLLRNKIYFLDGSLRDIYVLETTRRDWEKWIDFVNAKYEVEFYDHQNDLVKTKIDKESIFNFWDGKIAILNNATIKLGHISINCHFFCEKEIENDITPKEINSIEDHNKLIDYLQSISLFLNKKIILTPENYSSSDTELITIEKVEININEH